MKLFFHKATGLVYCGNYKYEVLEKMYKDYGDYSDYKREELYDEVEELYFYENEWHIEPEKAREPIKTNKRKVK